MEAAKVHTQELNTRLDNVGSEFCMINLRVQRSEARYGRVKKDLKGLKEYSKELKGNSRKITLKLISYK